MTKAVSPITALVASVKTIGTVWKSWSSFQICFFSVKRHVKHSIIGYISIINYWLYIHHHWLYYETNQIISIGYISYPRDIPPINPFDSSKNQPLFKGKERQRRPRYIKVSMWRYSPCSNRSYSCIWCSKKNQIGYVQTGHIRSYSIPSMPANRLC